MESKAILTGIQWRKSSYSGDQGGNCVEVAELPRHATVAVRDSKNPAGPALTLAPAAFTAFTTWASTTAE
ncbi:DUF397 domain-containing protein [Streptomyces sp. NPDC017230]|uniref:DUF397 domain-containing protein n=1 Tax=unclassified Streptomyces TaxID=2593676 RepID=UPI0037A66157